MTEKKEPYCILGNGTCPTECLLNEYSVKVTAKVGDKFDPVASRRAIVFRDVFEPDVNVIQIVAVIAKCLNEPKSSEKS